MYAVYSTAIQYCPVERQRVVVRISATIHSSHCCK